MLIFILNLSLLLLFLLSLLSLISYITHEPRSRAAPPRSARWRPRCAEPSPCPAWLRRGPIQPRRAARLLLLIISLLLLLLLLFSLSLSLISSLLLLMLLVTLIIIRPCRAARRRPGPLPWRSEQSLIISEQSLLLFYSTYCQRGGIHNSCCYYSRCLAWAAIISPVVPSRLALFTWGIPVIIAVRAVRGYCLDIPLDSKNRKTTKHNTNEPFEERGI